MKFARASLLASMFPLCANAAPFLMANPYPSTVTQPDGASYTINGGTPVACTIETVAGGVQPKCDLAGITAAGTYTLVMTVTRSANIVNGTNTGTVTQAGSASSVPFSYVLRSGAVTGPTLTVAP